MVQTSITLSRELKDLRAKNEELERQMLSKEQEAQIMKVKLE